jgi:folate-binding protein YgfZ
MAAIDPRGDVFFDLSPRTKLRVSGNDRLRFLNGQFSNDVGKATAAAAISAAVLSAKGRMEGHVFVSSGPNCFFVDADSELREKLPARLERYIIADDVQIEDASPEFSIFHVVGGMTPSMTEGCRAVSANRFGQAGTDIWVATSERESVFEKLSTAFSFCDDACGEVFRIEQGIPRWGRELTAEVIPVEANLEQTSIDYEKGCYIGQEVISRMKLSGQRNKKLSGFASVHDTPLTPGMKLFPIGEEKKEAGWITSATRSKRLGKEIALGYLKRPFPPTRFKLDAVDAENQFGAAAVRVEIVDLPFNGPVID